MIWRLVLPFDRGFRFGLGDGSLVLAFDRGFALSSS